MATMRESDLRAAVVIASLDQAGLPLNPILWNDRERLRARHVLLATESRMEIQRLRRQREAIRIN